MHAMPSGETGGGSNNQTIKQSNNGAVDHVCAPSNMFNFTLILMMRTARCSVAAEQRYSYSMINTSNYLFRVASVNIANLVGGSA